MKTFKEFIGGSQMAEGVNDEYEEDGPEGPIEDYGDDVHSSAYIQNQQPTRNNSDPITITIGSQAASVELEFNPITKALLIQSNRGTFSVPLGVREDKEQVIEFLEFILANVS